MHYSDIYNEYLYEVCQLQKFTSSLGEWLKKIITSHITTYDSNEVTIILVVDEIYHNITLSNKIGSLK